MQVVQEEELNLLGGVPMHHYLTAQAAKGTVMLQVGSRMGLVKGVARLLASCRSAMRRPANFLSCCFSQLLGLLEHACAILTTTNALANSLQGRSEATLYADPLGTTTTSLSADLQVGAVNRQGGGAQKGRAGSGF